MEHINSCVGEMQTQVVHMVTSVFLRVRTRIESLRKTGLKYATCRLEHLTHLPPTAREMNARLMNLLQPRLASISLADRNSSPRNCDRVRSQSGVEVVVRPRGGLT